MSVKTIFAAALLGLSSVANSAQATTIGFEDFNNAQAVSFLTEGYGFHWTGDYSELDGTPAYERSWVISPASIEIFTGTNAHSGNMFAWSNGGANIEVYGPEFTLNSFWARGGWGPSPLVVTGYKGGVEVYAETFSIDNTYQLITIKSALVDSVTFSTSSNLLLDDITVNAVPEPETYAMMLVGLGLIGTLTRRRKLA